MSRNAPDRSENNVEHQRNVRIMDENKIKKIEAQLRQLLKSADATPDQKQPLRRHTTGHRVIRRRKGQPDVKIA